MRDCFKGVYKGKRVLVTGHTGFKGAWLSIFLRELGAEVLGYSLKPPTEPNLFDSSGLEKKLNHIVGDVRDEGLIVSVMKDFQPEFVFHLAAQSLVRLSYFEPRLTYETNILGTVNVFEAVRKAGSVRVVVNVTSDKCYENREWVYGYRENDPMGGHDPYSSSKGCSELVTSAYRKSFFTSKEGNVALSSARAGNVVGGGDWAEDRLIPDCIRSLSQDMPLLIRYPKAVRPWQHVLEPLSGYLWLGALMYEDREAFSNAWNFGPSDDSIYSVEDVVKLTIKNWGGGDYSMDRSHHPHEAFLLKLDCSKANSILKWKSFYDINKTLEQTVQWYKEYYKDNSKANIYNISTRTIDNYLKYARANGAEWSKRSKSNNPETNNILEK